MHFRVSEGSHDHLNPNVSDWKRDPSRTNFWLDFRLQAVRGSSVESPKKYRCIYRPLHENFSGELSIALLAKPRRAVGELSSLVIWKLDWNTFFFFLLMVILTIMSCTCTWVLTTFYLSFLQQQGAYAFFESTLQWMQFQCSPKSTRTAVVRVGPFMTESRQCSVQNVHVQWVMYMYMNTAARRSPFFFVRRRSMWFFLF